MDMPVNPAISLLDEVKMQAQVLVPILRALRADLGEERANRLVISALREWSRDVFRRVAESVPGSPREKWAALMAEAAPRIGAKRNGGGGNRTPVRRSIHDRVYVRSLQINVAGVAPTGRIFPGHPAKSRSPCRRRSRGPSPKYGARSRPTGAGRSSVAT